MAAHVWPHLLVAMMRMGAMSLSSARFRKEKHSMSNMCTSSINRTCSREFVTTRVFPDYIAGRLTHPWDNLRLSLLPPLGHLGVDLFTNLTLDLSSVT